MSSETKSIWRKDGPYSWVVLVFIIINNFSSAGVLFGTVGLLTKEYTTVLGVESVEANVVGSVLIGVFLFTVPINVLLIKLCGCRVISGIGAVLSIGGFMSSAFATETWHLIIGYSVAAGLGFSMSMTSSIAIVPHYFKRRSNVAYMATGLGSGVALALLPIVFTKIRSVTSYRNTILYLIPVVSCCASGPIVYKPQIPLEKPKSMDILMRSYLHPIKRFPTFFYFLNAYLWNAGYVAVSVLLYSYVDKVSGADTAALAQTVCGIMEAVGGVVLTLVLIKFRLNHYVLHIVCNVTSGILCILLACLPSETMVYIFASMTGFLSSVTVGNMACVSQHLYPPADVEYAFGFQEAIGGIAGFIGPYTAGILQKQFGDSIGFYYMGAQLVFGGVLLIVAAIFRMDLWKSYEETEMTTPGGSSLIDSPPDTGLKGYKDNNSKRSSKDADKFVDLKLTE